ncbi:MAG: cell wall hydrolase [Bdellovibrionales bacterium]|nr:cell wall hydrolase [Bdellovibrionales bacterium]
MKSYNLYILGLALMTPLLFGNTSGSGCATTSVRQDGKMVFDQQTESFVAENRASRRVTMSSRSDVRRTTPAPTEPTAPTNFTTAGAYSARIDCGVGTSDLQCLTCNCYFEARGEPRAGQNAVIDVSLNRVGLPSWPNTICGVIHQPYQFSWLNDRLSNVINGNSDSARNCRAVSLARLGLPAEYRLPADHFAATYLRPSWTRRMTLVEREGGHNFFALYANANIPRSSAARAVASIEPEIRNTISQQKVNIGLEVEAALQKWNRNFHIFEMQNFDPQVRALFSGEYKRGDELPMAVVGNFNGDDIHDIALFGYISSKKNPEQVSQMIAVFVLSKNPGYQVVEIQKVPLPNPHARSQASILNLPIYLSMLSAEELIRPAHASLSVRDAVQIEVFNSSNVHGYFFNGQKAVEYLGKMP